MTCSDVTASQQQRANGRVLGGTLAWLQASLDSGTCGQAQIDLTSPTGKTIIIIIIIKIVYEVQHAYKPKIHIKYI